MRTHVIRATTLVAFGIALGAASPPSGSAPTKDGIVGSDVMGDRGRSGPDGWAWAPVTRDQAAGGTAPGQTAAKVKATPNAQPNPEAGKTLPRGEDPGTPAPTQATGPGTLDRAANAP